jgi:aminomethyltransferase
MKTPLFEKHVALGAKMVSFAGWDMPLSYRGILPEHRQTREKASVFDTSHMGTFDFSGPRACADLDSLLTQSVSGLKTGGCAYGYLLAEDGGVLDDLICFRRGADSWRLVVNAGTRENDAEWIKERLSPGTAFEDVSTKTAKLDVQGPLARKELEAAVGTRLPDLRYFHFAEIEWNGAGMMVSRTGYTGEFGYELFLPSDMVVLFWNLLLSKSGILPAGLGARDVLRLEMGYPLYGHELDRGRTPAGASGGRFIDGAKSFIGREAVVRDLASDATRRLAGLRLEGRQAARAHDVVLRDGIARGEVTSGLFSPSLNCAIALANIDKDVSGVGERLEIRVRDRMLKAEVVELPFYQGGTARAVA